MSMSLKIVLIAKTLLVSAFFHSSVMAEEYCPDEVHLTANMEMTMVGEKLVSEEGFSFCKHQQYVLLSPNFATDHPSFDEFTAVKQLLVEGLERNGVQFRAENLDHSKEITLKKFEMMVYDVLKGDTLQDVVRKIAADENHNVVWRLNRDFAFEVDTNYVCYSGYFENCIQGIAKDFIDNDVGINFTLYTKNKTLLIKEK